MIGLIIGLIAGTALGYWQRDRIEGVVDSWRDRFED